MEDDKSVANNSDANNSNTRDSSPQALLESDQQQAAPPIDTGLLIHDASRW